mgnify:CR=1 FL=1
MLQLMLIEVILVMIEDCACETASSPSQMIIDWLLKLSLHYYWNLSLNLSCDCDCDCYCFGDDYYCFH